MKPTNPYSASKASADLVAVSYFKTHNFPVIITRCSNNYGPYQYPEKLIPLVINNITNNKNTGIWQWKTNKRLDLCRRSLFRNQKALEQGHLGQIYNFGGYSELTNLEVIELLLK